MRFRNLERFRTGGTSSRMQLSIPLPTTPDGRVYRYSPNETAHPRHFVLGQVVVDFVTSEEARARMKLSPRSKQTVCPYSGFIDVDDAFTHPDDMSAAKEVVQHAALADVRSALHGMFSDMGRQFSSNKFVRIDTGSAPSIPPRPRFSRRDLLRELVCDHCGRDYGVYAIGLFCPDCGAPNLHLHFAREVELVSAQVDLAESLNGQDELAYRLLGNAHEDVLTAFEATLKAVYLFGIAQLVPTPATRPVRNDFQNVDNAKVRFSELGVDPFDALSADELDALKLNIQKRHIIGHNLGVMDERFADHAEDARLGETVLLVGEDIRRFGTLAQFVVDQLDVWLAGGNPLPTSDVHVTKLTDTSSANEQGSEEPAVGKGSYRNMDLTVLAVEVGKWIVQQSKDGREFSVDLDKLCAAFPEADKRAIGEALAELTADGFIETHATMGHALPRVRPNLDLYATFDPLAGLDDPVADSITLANLVLAGPDNVSVVDLHKSVDWPLRRFNPAIGLVIAHVDDRRVSRALDPTYPSRHFGLAADDRVALKRYVANFSR